MNQKPNCRFGESVDPHGDLGRVGRTIRRFERGREDRPKVRYRLVGVTRSTRKSGRGREAHPKFWEGSRGYPGGPGWVERPTLKVREGL